MNRQAYRGYAGALAFALLVLATAAQAKILYVDDDGKTNFRSIAAAIEAAASGDIIVVEPGVYSGANGIAGKALTLRSRDPNNPTLVAGTIVDCQAGPYATTCAFSVGAPDRDRVALAGLTIRNSSGSALQCDGAQLDVTNCTFKDNTSTWTGGAVLSRSSNVRFTGCTFSGNVSEAVRGGAIFCTNSVLELTNCSFEANRGCAIVNYDSRLILRGCTFHKNTGEEGAAIHSRKDSSSQIAASVSVAKCTFTNNSASASGGAIYGYYGQAMVSTCTFSANTAGQDGGAIYGSSAYIMVVNSAFLGNTAGGIGGGIASWSGSSPGIVNCTFTTNRATSGGAVANRGPSALLLSHSILWNNTAAEGPNLFVAPSVWEYIGATSVTVEYSDVAGGPDGVHVAGNATLNWSTGNLNTDPLFRGVSDRSLSATSPCIDAGDPSYVPNADVVDLVGNPRRTGKTVDMGAYEAGPVPVFRFWSPLTERYFYTTGRGERDKLIREYANVWTYEGIAFYASSRPLDNMVAVYRLWSPRQSSHFWTLDEKEAQALGQQSPDIWTYEGIAFYVYLPYKQPWGTVPIHRFWWTQRGGQFFTASDEERDRLMKYESDKWAYEGVVWYALSGPSK